MTNRPLFEESLIALDRITGDLLFLRAEAHSGRRRQVGKAAPGRNSPDDKKEGDGPKRSVSAIDPAHRREAQGANGGQACGQTAGPAGTGQTTACPSRVS